MARTKTSKRRVEKTIALIAHDGKKTEMIEFVAAHRSFFKGFRLVATATTGEHVEKIGLPVEKVLSGPLGGDAQIAAMVATGTCDAVIFFRDPLGMHPHEPDISGLLRICEVHDVPLATNPASARLFVAAFRSLG